MEKYPKFIIRERCLKERYFKKEKIYSNKKA